MTDPTDPRRPPPPVASGRSWWFWGGFAGIRYRAALHFRVLEPDLTDPASERLPAVGPAALGPPPADARRARTEVEAWEGEGGAVVE